MESRDRWEYRRSSTRFVQQAVALVLSEEYEKLFKDMSFGFRPNRSCRLAVRRAMEHVKDGYMWVVDLDLRKFFDTVNHSKLIQLLSDRIEDGRVVSLIHKFLRAPICEEGKVGKPNTIGTPQGGVISPLLANIRLKAKGFGRSAMRMTLFSLQKAEKRPKGCLNGSLTLSSRNSF